MKSIDDTLDAFISMGYRIAQNSWIKTALQALIAGIVFAVGALACLMVMGGLTTMRTQNPSLASVVGACFYPLGAILVLFCGGQLITTNVPSLLMGVLSSRVGWPRVLLNWVTVLVFNFFGAYLTTFFLAYRPGLFDHDPNNTFLTEFVTLKLGARFGDVFLLSMGGGVLSGVGWWWATSAEESSGKALGLWLPFAAMHVIGFPHVVSEVLYSNLGILLDFTTADFGRYLGSNAIPVFLGNLLGGVVVVGTALFVALQKCEGCHKDEEAKAHRALVSQPSGAALLAPDTPSAPASSV